MIVELMLGDCLEVLKTIPDNSIDSIVTDPPYGIGFMNKEWDNPQKHKELIEREKKRSEQRYTEGKSPAKVGFSTGVQPGLPIGGAKEGKWFQDWCELWARECYRVLKPGGHALSFAAPRTYHRMATAFEDVGFQIRDQIMWVFGSGFPKSLNIGKAIDKIEGNERKVLGTKAEFSLDGAKRNPNNHREIGEAAKEIQHEYGYKQGWDAPVTKGNSDWEGWGTALKPAHEPIVMVRKPLSEKTIVENVLKHGTGGINIDGSRIEFEDTQNAATNPKFRKENGYKMPEPGQESNGAVNFTSSKNEYDTSGRFPANIIFDEEAGKLLDEQSGISKSVKGRNDLGSSTYGGNSLLSSSTKMNNTDRGYDDKGGASRFFYCPKTSKKDRNEGLDKLPDIDWRKDSPANPNRDDRPFLPTKNNHPTVKPTDLMRYLINLITPPNGTILDPFMGSGTTGKAAVRCGFNFIGIEKEEEYMEIAKARINHEINENTNNESI